MFEFELLIQICVRQHDDGWMRTVEYEQSTDCAALMMMGFNDECVLTMVDE